MIRVTQDGFSGSGTVSHDHWPSLREGKPGPGLSFHGGKVAPEALIQELRRRGWPLTDLPTDEGHEVDFLGWGSRGERRLVPVCADVSAQGAREREVRALAAAMRERKLDRAELVTLFQRDEFELPEGNVRVVPAWQWLAQSDQKDR